MPKQEEKPIDAPLAIDSDGQRFQWPTSAVRWRLFYSPPGHGGRPLQVLDDTNSAAHLPPTATTDDLDDLTRQPGVYRLWPVDPQGRKVGQKVAVVTIMGEHAPDEPIPQNVLEHCMLQMQKNNNDLVGAISKVLGAQAESATALASTMHILRAQLEHNQEPDDKTITLPVEPDLPPAVLEMLKEQVMPTIGNVINGAIAKFAAERATSGAANGAARK